MTKHSGCEHILPHRAAEFKCVIKVATEKKTPSAAAMSALKSSADRNLLAVQLLKHIFLRVAVVKITVYSVNISGYSWEILRPVAVFSLALIG